MYLYFRDLWVWKLKNNFEKFLQFFLRDQKPWVAVAKIWLNANYAAKNPSGVTDILFWY